MIKNILTFILFSSLISACDSGKSYSPAVDAQDAGREFIRASLDGDIEKARFFLLQDSVNLYLLETWKKNFYDKLNPEDRRSYREANILPIKILNENDSTVLYEFTNSFKKEDTTYIKIVRSTDTWLVDLKDLH